MSNAKPIHILLIEDNPGDVRLIQEIMSGERRIRTEIASAGTLGQGINFLSKNPVDLLLLDLNLPDSHGLKTLDKLTLAFPELPIVIMTGLDDEEIAIHAMAAGAQDYIVKGNIDLETLGRVISFALERNNIKQRLYKSEARFRKMIEKNSDGVIIVDEEGVIRFVNTAWENLSGRNQAELVGSSFGFPIETEDTVEINILRPDQKETTVEIRVTDIDWEGEDVYLISCRDITVRKRLEIERERLISDLKKALAEIETLSGLLPICAYCKKIKNDEGYWTQIEAYIQEHSGAKFSHGICKECAEEHFPGMDLYDGDDND